MIITLILYYGLQQVYYITHFFCISFYHELMFVGNDIHVYKATMQQTTSPTQHRKMNKQTPMCLRNRPCLLISREVCSSLVTRK